MRLIFIILLLTSCSIKIDGRNKTCLDGFIWRCDDGGVCEQEFKSVTIPIECKTIKVDSSRK
jgi:hypothetical protein